jgi:NAD(P)-dependent dehydrogenase (short-subunit alcohol dehydrogenase family)
MAPEQRVVLVTGSTRGIGRSVAAAFANLGDVVVINSRDPTATAFVAAELGPSCVGVACDISTLAGVEALFEIVRDRFRRLDVLVNNAGMSMVRESVDLTREDWQRTLDLNLTAAFQCCQRAARMMRDATEGGNIINIASLTAFSPFPKRVAYAVSKAGLVMMTKVLAIEWAPHIRVNAVAPGFIRTGEIDALAQAGHIDLQAIERRTPQGRLGTPDDVANACTFLASRNSGFVTGQTLIVDGGWIAYGYT